MKADGSPRQKDPDPSAFVATLRNGLEMTLVLTTLIVNLFVFAFCFRHDALRCDEPKWWWTPL
jgi:hypothetical protein